MTETKSIPAWAEISNELRRFVYRRVKDREAAYDIVQDVFVKAQLKNSQLKDEEKFTAWMYSITRNAIIDHFRAGKKELEPILLEGDEPYNDFNDCVAYCLKEMMAQLPSPYREALEQTELHNVPQKELAFNLGISYSGAKSRVQRARQMLKNKMNELYHIETDKYGNVMVCEDKLPCGCDNQYKE